MPSGLWDVRSMFSQSSPQIVKGDLSTVCGPNRSLIGAAVLFLCLDQVTHLSALKEMRGTNLARCSIHHLYVASIVGSSRWKVA